MTEIAEPLVTEAQAKAAHQVHTEIVGIVAQMRKGWVQLAGRLWDFTEQSMWRSLGYSSFEQWLASPEVAGPDGEGLSRRSVYYLLEVWRELVIKRGLEPRELEECGMSKVTEVLPAVRRGHVELEAAIADAKVLGRDDLREKYATATAARRPDRPLDADAEPEYATCPHCGSRYQVKT